MLSINEIEDIVQNIYNKWWPIEKYPPYYLRWRIKQTAFHISIIVSILGNKATICDIGGGWGMFLAGCSAIGMSSILIDDFGDTCFLDSDDLRPQLLNEFNITVLKQNVLEKDIDFPPESIDAFTAFDIMEHFHHSPKSLFTQIVSSLKSGGLFLIGVPNCVNLYKRLTVMLGIEKWSSMYDWYETTPFRGHVREPSLGDLKYIAKDLGLKDIKTFGRNWLGYYNPNKTVRIFTNLINRPLCLRPSFCSNIYMIGKKCSI